MDESDEEKKQLLLEKVRSIFDRITPATEEVLTNEFLELTVYQSPGLANVISIIFDKAVTNPKFGDLYAKLCSKQYIEERKIKNKSLFFKQLLFHAQSSFLTMHMKDFVNEKQADIDSESDKTKRLAKQRDLLQAQNVFRSKRLGNIVFIGHLYHHNLLNIKIMQYCVDILLKSISDITRNMGAYDADDDSIECAVRLLETIGKRVQSENNSASAAAAAAATAKVNPVRHIIGRGDPLLPEPPQPPPRPVRPPPPLQFPLDLTLRTLVGAMPIVSKRVGFLIMNLVELRLNGWVPRKTEDELPRALELIEIDAEVKQDEKGNVKVRIPVCSSHNSIPGEITGQRTIAEYSVTEDRKVHNDRRNARYLCESAIKEDVNHDLTIGLESFIDKGKFLQNEPCLGTLCDWAIRRGSREMKSIGETRMKTEQCYAFLHSVLKEMKKFLLSVKNSDNEACEISFNFYKGVIELKSISKEEANANGKGLTEEFIAHFKLSGGTDAAGLIVHSTN